MINRLFYIPLIILLFSITSCNPSVTPKNLFGKWKYIKVENPNASPPDSVSASELEIQKPYIQFSNTDSVIMWGGKVLSHGTYHVDGQNIRYKEVLEDGTREFPFWVSKLTDKEIVFETTGADKSRVTAVRE